MRSMAMTLGFSVAAALSAASAQDNTVEGLDAFIRNVTDLRMGGREGDFPDGRNGLSCETTVCNTGIVEIPWKAAMQRRHPFIAFLVARESGGRFEQISDRSFVKHGFFATNTSVCDNCSDDSDPSVLAVGCSDTYFFENNSDRYWLAPPDEIDPWLGAWDPVCSHFDRGEPPVDPPFDCDGIRSLDETMIGNMGPVRHRIEVSDADLDVDGARFYYYGQYVVRGEAEDLRLDNSASREVLPVWNGNRWNFDVAGDGRLMRSSILRRWEGAKLRSSSNGLDDGRVFLGSQVTGPDGNGMYHYEYAMHNRDNSRGVKSLLVPMCPKATVINAGFRDIDGEAANDWSFVVDAAEVIWSTESNPLEWNTIYNFWFDSDTPPAESGNARVEEFRVGMGFDAFGISATAPMGPAAATDIGFGKAGSNGMEPDFQICGGLGLGEHAELVLHYAAPISMAFLFIANQNLGFDYRGGTIVPYPPNVITAMCTDDQGRILCPVDGVGGSFTLYLQWLVMDQAAEGQVAFSNALEIIEG